MRNDKIKNIGTLCGTALAVLFLLLVITLLAPQEALAFDEEGYIKFIVSKVNESNNNSTNTDAVQIPEAARALLFLRRVIWLRKYVIICIGSLTAHTILCSW